MTEPEELLKLIDKHIDMFEIAGGKGYLQGMRAIRQLVKNFFNAPKKEETPNDQQDFEL